MAESKSDYFLFEINAHSEKFAKFGSISINELVRISESSDVSAASGAGNSSRMR
jgi:hypothetical protein